MTPKTSLTLQSLIAAVPAALLGVVAVLGLISSAPTTLKIFLVVTLILAAVLALMPVGIFLKYGKKKVAAEPGAAAAPAAAASVSAAAAVDDDEESPAVESEDLASIDDEVIEAVDSAEFELEEEEEAFEFNDEEDEEK
ncbi:MAG: hypothetical protein KF774_10375 [Planctomyces sp.]|nr:hypothetical protein [Planctomyces sp.]